MGRRRGGRAGRGLPREAFVWILPAQKPTAVFSALPLRGRSRTDTSPVRTGRKAASSKNPAVIFAREPGKIQTKASAPRPADGGHDRAFYKRALRGGGGGARSGGKRSEVRIQRSGDQARKRFFHGMESLFLIFPRYGKIIGNVRKCVIFGGEAFGRLWHHLAFD